MGTIIDFLTSEKILVILAILIIACITYYMVKKVVKVILIIAIALLLYYLYVYYDVKKFFNYMPQRVEEIKEEIKKDKHGMSKMSGNDPVLQYVEEAKKDLNETKDKMNRIGDAIDAIKKI